MGLDVHTAPILTVRLGGEVFAIPAGIVREIVDVGRVTRVPTAPAFVRNLINVRGRVVPLADLRLRFGMPAAEPTMDTRIVVLEIGLEGEPATVAVVADKVYEVTQLDEVVSTGRAVHWITLAARIRGCDWPTQWPIRNGARHRQDICCGRRGRFDGIAVTCGRPTDTKRM